MALDAADFPLEDLQQVAPVERAGQRIGNSQPAQFLFQAFPLADVHHDATNAHGLAARIACDHLAPEEHPDPFFILPPQAIFGLVTRCALIQMGAQGLPNGGQIAGMNVAFPLFVGKLQRAGLAPQQFGPGSVAGDRVGANIPVPQAQIGAPQRQRQPLLTFLYPAVESVALQRHFHRRHQFALGDRLDQIAVGVGRLGPFQLGSLGIGGQIDNRNVVFDADMLGGGDAVHRAGQSDVHQHQVGRRRCHCRHRRLARGHRFRRGITNAGEHVLQAGSDDAVILDDQNGFTGHGGLPSYRILEPNRNEKQVP